MIQAFSAAEDNRDYDALDAIVAEYFVRHSAATPDVMVTSRDELKEFFAANAASFSSYTTESTAKRSKIMRICALSREKIRVIRVIRVFLQ